MPVLRKPISIPSAVLGILLLAAPALPAAVDYEKDVAPFLKSKCYECHTGKKTETDKKPKGGLALDTPAGILAGKVMEPGNPEESSLYYRLILPESDDDVMPPAKENKAATKAEIETIKAWIAEGSHFGKGGGAPVGPVKVLSLDEVKTMGLKEPNPDAVRALTDLGATVTALAVDMPQLLSVEFISTYGSVGDDEVKQLMSIAPNIVELDLSRTNITDEAMKYVGAFARLSRLNINNTKITDKGMAEISGLANLDWLNLYGTPVTDGALPSIAKLRNLKSVYLWNSGISPEGVAKLQQSLSSAKIVDKVWSESSRFDLDDL